MSHDDDGMLHAAEIFGGAAPVIVQIKDVIVAYLTGKCDETDSLPALFTQAAAAMKCGFEITYIGGSIMCIEHIAMYVTDLEKTKDFFVKYFNAAVDENYYNKASGFCSYFLSFDGGARLEIMTKPQIQANEKALEHAGYIHIAFRLGSKQAVDELTQRLCEDGYRVVSGPRMTGDGYYESCIAGIEENLIEITE